MVPLSLRDFRETNKELLKVQSKQTKDWLSFQKKQDKACFVAASFFATILHSLY